MRLIVTDLAWAFGGAMIICVYNQRLLLAFFSGPSIVINNRALKFVPTGDFRDTTQCQPCLKQIRNPPVSAADLEKDAQQ